MENKVKEMVKVINMEIRFANEEYDVKSEDYKRIKSKVRGMLDMLEIATGKCYITEVFNSVRDKQMNCIENI